MCRSIRLIMVMSWPLGKSIARSKASNDAIGVEMNVASTLVLFSLLVPGRGWYAPDQPLSVTVHASGDYTLTLTDFTGREFDAEGSADVAGDKAADARKIFPQLANAGTYVLYANRKGATAAKDFVGTP